MDENMVFSEGNVVHNTQFERIGDCYKPYNLHLPKNSSLRFLIKVLTGFTLIELLVTLSVFAIILTLIVPSLQTMILNNRLTSNLDSLVSSLNYARSVALEQGVNVRVCPLGTPGSTNCGNNWNSGWIVVTQPALGVATLLNSHQTSTNDPDISANVNSVLFDPHGLSTTQSNFSVCDSRGNSHARSAMVLATGFVQSGQTPGQAVWNNGAINCP
jgi:type IV fimbrial biogenesis protein FimT